MVAGFVAGYLEKKDYQYALDLGTARPAGCEQSREHGMRARLQSAETGRPR